MTGEFFKVNLKKKKSKGRERNNEKNFKKKIKRNRDEKTKLGVDKTNISVALIFLRKGP